MRENKFSMTKILPFTVFLLIVSIDTGLYSLTVMNGTERLSGLIILVAFLGLVRFSKLMFSSHFFDKLAKTFPIFFLSLIFPVIQCRDNIKQMLIFILPWILGYFFTLFVSYNEFKALYLAVMKFLAIYSLVTLLLAFIFPNILELFPLIIKNGGVYHNLIFSVINNESIVLRNYSVFWEPGTYSIYLCIALYFSLFEEKFNVRRITLFIVAILTTVSTLGIICMIVLFLSYITTSHTFVSKRLKFSVIILSFIAMITFLFMDAEFLFNVFSKLDITRLDLDISTRDRIFSIIFPFRSFIKSPITGVGVTQFLAIVNSVCNGITTCTFLNWLCMYGVLGGFIPVFGCIIFFLSNKYSFFTKIGLFVFSLLIFSTEDFIYFIFIFILIFYGFQKNNKKLKRTI